jgi:hypothetical protein
MKHWNGGFRVQYQTKRLWRKLVDTTFETQQHVVEAFEEGMRGMGLLDSSQDDSTPDDEMSEASSDDIGRVVTGQLNQGRRYVNVGMSPASMLQHQFILTICHVRFLVLHRIDYMLQGKMDPSPHLRSYFNPLSRRTLSYILAVFRLSQKKRLKTPMNTSRHLQHTAPIGLKKILLSSSHGKFTTVPWKRQRHLILVELNLCL